MFIDESHVTVTQIGGMYKGDASRKQNLVDYGFRLPSARDNRPLKFHEFEKVMPQTVFVSATPAKYEEEHAGQVVEQVVRPTGLVDPQIIIRPVATQVDDLMSEINDRIQKGERVLVTTLTKRMAEQLTDYYSELGIKVRYLHSDIDTVERVESLEICGSACLTYSSASTSCARAWTSPKSPSSPSSTPTKKASYAHTVA